MRTVFRLPPGRWSLPRNRASGRARARFRPLSIRVVLVEAAFEADVSCLAALPVDDEPHRHPAGGTDRRAVRRLRSLFLELEGDGVDAVAHSRRIGSVREDVAEMAVAGRAANLGAHHALAQVELGLDGVLGSGRVEG